MSEADYTFSRYGALLETLCDHDCEFVGYGAALSDGQVVLRHDVDWSPEKARRMAHIEADRGVRATYFFLVTSPFYNVLFDRVRAAIGEVHSLGHDVALHFSTHQYWADEPATDELARRVREEQAVLGTVTAVADVVSFHRPPEWTLDREFPFPSAYEPRYFSEITYLADSSGRWRADPPDLEDPPARIQLLTHPGLWGDTDAGFEARLREQQRLRFDEIRGFLADEFLR